MRLEISWAGSNTSLSSLCLKNLLSNSPKLTFALMSLCNDSICILFLKWKATAIIQLLVFPQTRAIKLTEKKNVPYLSVSSTGVPLPPSPHQQPYPLYSNAQRRVAQCIIPPNWSKFLFACFKEVPVKSIMKITLGWQVFCHTSYIKALLSASNQYATRIRPRPHVSGDFCIAIFFMRKWCPVNRTEYHFSELK